MVVGDNHMTSDQASGKKKHNGHWEVCERVSRRNIPWAYRGVACKETTCLLKNRGSRDSILDQVDI